MRCVNQSNNNRVLSCDVWCGPILRVVGQRWAERTSSCDWGTQIIFGIIIIIIIIIIDQQVVIDGPDFFVIISINLIIIIINIIINHIRHCKEQFTFIFLFLAKPKEKPRFNAMQWFTSILRATHLGIFVWPNVQASKKPD